MVIKNNILNRDFNVGLYFCSHLFIHNLRVLDVNLSDNVLYLETFTFKLAKHKMVTQMLRKPHIFYSLSQLNAQFVISAIFFIVNFFLVSLQRNALYLTLRSKTSAVLFCFYRHYKLISILLNMLTII